MLSRQFSNLTNLEIQTTQKYKSHDLGIEKILFIKNTENFLTSSHDKTLKLWTIKKKKPLHTFQKIHKEGIWDFDYNKKKNVVISTGPDSQIVFFDLKLKKVIKTVKFDAIKGYSLALSADGNKFLVGGQNGFLELFDINGNLLEKYDFSKQIIYDTKNYGDNFIICTSNGELIFFDKNLKKIFSQKISENEILTFAVNNDDIYVSTKDNNIVNFKIDLKNKVLVEISSCEGHCDKLTAFLVDNRHSYLFTGANDGSIFAWDLNGMVFRHNLIGHLERVSSMDLNDNNLISASWDQTVCCFNLLQVEKK